MHDDSKRFQIQTFESFLLELHWLVMEPRPHPAVRVLCLTHAQPFATVAKNVGTRCVRERTTAREPRKKVGTHNVREDSFSAVTLNSRDDRFFLCPAHALQNIFVEAERENHNVKCNLCFCYVCDRCVGEAKACAVVRPVWALQHAPGDKRWSNSIFSKRMALVPTESCVVLQISSKSAIR